MRDISKPLPVMIDDENREENRHLESQKHNAIHVFVDKLCHFLVGTFCQIHVLEVC